MQKAVLWESWDGIVGYCHHTGRVFSNLPEHLHKSFETCIVLVKQHAVISKSRACNVQLKKEVQ